jgi:hypothetical protein
MRRLPSERTIKRLMERAPSGANVSPVYFRWAAAINGLLCLMGILAAARTSIQSCHISLLSDLSRIDLAGTPASKSYAVQDGKEAHQRFRKSHREPFEPEWFTA